MPAPVTDSTRSAALGRDTLPNAPPRDGQTPSGAQEARWPYVDRRDGGDRRARPTTWWDSLQGRKRRVRGRRRGESRNIYVDIYDRWDLILMLVIFVLNVFDALLTLVYLGQGGREANPIMAEVLGYGVTAFVLEKCFVVALCLVALVVHKTFRLARIATYWLLVAYGLLTVRHLVLQLQVAAG